MKDILIEKELNDLRNKYKFKFDIDSYYTAKQSDQIIESLFMKLFFSFDNYDFKKKLKEIKNKIKSKNDNSLANKLKKIDELEENVVKLREETLNDYTDYTILKAHMDASYENNEDKKGVLDVYYNIIYDILWKTS